jgi:hypothetical protein
VAGDTEPRVLARRLLSGTLTVVLVAVSTTVTSWLVGRAVTAVSGEKMATWVVGRSAGIASYLLLVALVAMGLVLSHPWRARVRRPSTASRLRLHASLAVFTLAFTVLHIVVLATDEYAGVGWKGALLPMGSQHRPVPVTLGVIGLYAGILAGVTAALAGRFASRVWWPLHKVGSVSLVLVWLHGVLAGSDTLALLALYLGTGLAVVGLGVSRYAARTHADLVAEIDHRRRPAAPPRPGKRPLEEVRL